MKILWFWIYVMAPGTMLNMFMFILHTSLETFLLIEAMLLFIQTVVTIIYFKIRPKEESKEVKTNVSE